MVEVVVVVIVAMMVVAVRGSVAGRVGVSARDGRAGIVCFDWWWCFVLQ